MTLTGGFGEGDRDDGALVAAVLRDLREAADRWEALVAEAENITYCVDFGDVRAVINADGRLLELSLGPHVGAAYRHDELSERINAAFQLLRAEARADNQARYGSEPT